MVNWEEKKYVKQLKLNDEYFDIKDEQAREEIDKLINHEVAVQTLSGSFPWSIVNYSSNDLSGEYLVTYDRVNAEIEVLENKINSNVTNIINNTFSNLMDSSYINQKFNNLENNIKQWVTENFTQLGIIEQPES